MNTRHEVIRVHLFFVPRAELPHFCLFNMKQIKNESLSCSKAHTCVIDVNTCYIQLQIVFDGKWFSARFSMSRNVHKTLMDCVSKSNYLILSCADILSMFVSLSLFLYRNS
jgi:hypothetical protein